jgi:hypothetical protein
VFSCPRYTSLPIAVALQGKEKQTERITVNTIPAEEEASQSVAEEKELLQSSLKFL